MPEVISPGMLRDGAGPRATGVSLWPNSRLTTAANPVDGEQGKLPCVRHRFLVQAQIFFNVVKIFLVEFGFKLFISVPENNYLPQKVTIQKK